MVTGVRGMSSTVKVKQSAAEKAGDAVIYTMLVAIAIVTLYPFWYVLIISLNDSNVINYSKVYFWTSALTLDNFRVVFTTNALFNGFKISVLRTVVGSLFSVVCNAALAYGLTKKKLLGRNFFLNIIIITLFFSGGLIPFFLLLKQLAILNTFWVYIVPLLFSPWTIILMKTYFSSLPVSLEEAAKIDGANDLKVFCKIVIPTSMPLLATMLLFAAVSHWNDWIMGEIYVLKPVLHPIQTVLMRLITQMSASDMIRQSMNAEFITKVPSMESVKMAAIVVTTIPILLVYPFLQKYFVQGVMIGAIKE